jgi:hypothetical protein
VDGLSVKRTRYAYINVRSEILKYIITKKVYLYAHFCGEREHFCGERELVVSGLGNNVIWSSDFVLVQGQVYRVDARSFKNPTAFSSFKVIRRDP